MEEIDSTGPSANVGISCGDVILSIAEKPVEEDCSATEACRRIIENSL